MTCVAMVPCMTRTRYLAAGVALAIALTGCSDGGEPPAAPSPSAVAATSAAPATSARPTPDGYAQRACQKNAEAQDATGDSIEPLAVVAREAQQSSLEPIVRAGALLDESVKLAEAAQGADDEAAMEAHAVAASFDFGTACVEAGMVY